MFLYVNWATSVFYGIKTNGISGVIEESAFNPLFLDRAPRYFSQKYLVYLSHRAIFEKPITVACIMTLRESFTTMLS